MLRSREDESWTADVSSAVSFSLQSTCSTSSSLREIRTENAPSFSQSMAFDWDGGLVQERGRFFPGGSVSSGGTLGKGGSGYKTLRFSFGCLTLVKLSC